MRTAGPKLIYAKVVWKICRFLVLSHEKKDSSEEEGHVPRPEWPSLRYDYRQNLRTNSGMLVGFINGMFEPGQFLELTAPGSSGEWT